MDTANYNLPLEENWLFHKGDFKAYSSLPGSAYHGMSQTGGGLEHLRNFHRENEWKPIRLPHDWFSFQKIDKKQDATVYSKKRGVAWYKNQFHLPKEEIESAELVFDGVLGQTTVFVNGVLAGRNFSGYNRFSIEISDYLLPGCDNEIVLFVDARRWEGWWYEGAGLYRPVHIRFRKNLRFFQDDCFIRTDGKEILVDLSTSGVGQIETLVTDKDGEIIAKTTTKTDGKLSIRIPVESPKLWSPENPYLYDCKFTLFADEKVDEFSVCVGFRDIEWNKDTGLYLNGKPYTIKGVCCHQDHAGLGAGVDKMVEEYRLSRIKSLGANAYRCAHHAPSESLLSLCDKLGLLVMVENRHFDVSEETLKQVDALVKLSRNHPCVFLYCAFNEEPWQAETRGKRILSKIRDRILRLDTTRYVTGAQNGGSLLSGNASEVMDIIGMNYNLDAYEKCREKNPDKLIIGTENSPTFATRGVMKTDKKKQVFADNSYEYPKDFSQPLYETMDTVKKYPFVTGCFVWSAFAHLGEPNPFEYPSVSSHWGFLDLCGFDKNIAHLLRAYYIDEPFLKLCEPYKYKKGDKAVIRAFTNCEKVEAFVNGKSLGEKTAVNRIVEWETSFEAGEISVKSGKIKDVVKTAKKPYLLCVEEVAKEKTRIFNLSVRDSDGTLISAANKKLKIIVDKKRILGVGNGDPNGKGYDTGNSVRLFNGLAQVIVYGKGEISFLYPKLKRVCIKD